MTTLEEIEAFCLSFPGASLTVQWGDNRVLKVGGKMFALLGPTPTATVAIKCSDVAFRMLSERPGIAPAPYLARAGWVRLERLDALDREDLLDYLRAAYGLIVARLPRAERERLTAALKAPPPTRH